MDFDGGRDDLAGEFVERRINQHPQASSNQDAERDFVVEDLVIVEVKSVAALLPVHEAQVLTYLNLSGYPAGLLMNFNVEKLVMGVRRLLNRSVMSARRGPEGTG